MTALWLIGLLIGIELISVGSAIAYLAWQVRRVQPMGELTTYNRFGRSTAKLKHEESAWFDANRADCLIFASPRGERLLQRALSDQMSMRSSPTRDARMQNATTPTTRRPRVIAMTLNGWGFNK